MSKIIKTFGSSNCQIKIFVNMTEKPRTYLITVTILEGRHYIWENMNSAVIVKVDTKKKCTAVRKCSDSPFYNEYFVFELDCTYEKLMDKSIAITVIQPKTFCRKRKILGVVKLDVATVLAQKNSQFYHKWAVLASPKTDMVSGPTGYLKVDITILSRGQIPKLPVNIVNDEIEGNLLIPTGFVTERQRAQFIFDIYKCENLSTKTAQFSDYGPNKNNPTMDAKPSTYIEVSFAGFTASTTIRKSTQSPIFNEKLTITDLFPPLCQRIKIDICYSSISKSVHATHFLNLKSISNDNVEGFLPTFGPTYVYLYSHHNLEGYAGSLLMSMKTEILDNTVTTSAAQKVNISQGTALDEENLYNFEETFLFATLFEANCISKKYGDKPISFRMTFGNIASEKEIEGFTGDGHPANVSVAQKPLKSGKNFYYLNFGEEKPCLRIKSRWPDFRKRMFNSNMLDKISKMMKTKLEEIEKMFMKQNPNISKSIDEGLRETQDFLIASGRKYVEILSTNYNIDYGTVLDKERINMCLKSMNGILERIEALANNKSKKFIFRKLENIQNKIDSLVEDAQACWPDVYVWMTFANKKIACLRIPARDVVFSNVEEEMGEFCGKLRPMIFFVKEKNVVICKLEILMWLGLHRQKEECFKILPNGFKYEGRLLIAEEKHIFECRAYMFEGEVQPGFDESGLVDAYLQVAFGKEIKETQVKYKVLVPVWDQTLIFRNVYLYGSIEHIGEYPPSILVQMFDKDPFMQVELIGRHMIKPTVKFLHEIDEDKNHVPLSWYSMYKHGEILGEVLAAFELTEIPEPTNIHDEETIVAIPTHIKPQLLSYKIEIVFWGVRHLKKINLIRINRPRIAFFCANKVVNSETIMDAKKNSNFSNYITSLEVSMANQIENPEAFRLKLFDSRKFGIYVYAGIGISDTTQFLFTPLTVQDRMTLLSGANYQSMSFMSVTSSEVAMDNWEKAIVLRTSSKTDKSKGVPFKKCCSWLAHLSKHIFGKDGLGGKLTGRKKSEYSLLSTGEQEEEEDDFDWWTKFYASIDEQPTAKGFRRNKLKVYQSELESQPEFKSFSDMLTSFEIFKGKRTGDETLDEENTTAVFKGSVKIYRWPPEDDDLENYVTPSGTLVKDGVFNNFPDNSPRQFVLRIYCVRAISLRPKDLNGKSDPYLCIALGNKYVNDRVNYIPRQVNPIFGRVFEFQASFPEDNCVTIKIFDYDLTSSDDLIGETKIDLENRFYTKHRAWCGISESYHDSGYCLWRDQKKPSVILKEICKQWGTDTPEFRQTSVCIGFKEFFPEHFKPSGDPDFDQEVLALAALRRWQEMPVVGFKIVPEHVETRSLFSPDKPGIEQGKLQLWIDMFPRLDYPPPEKVDIVPRKPVAYELRVVIWNTEEVTLEEDDFFTGEKKSDIYVKGWLDDPSNSQYTDVHYRSLTGEGNFNWRFVFPFEYLSTENKLVIKKKESVFDREETEIKIPCKLNMTVWDNDTFSKDDFLGSLSLELCKLPRGARSSKKCTLSVLDISAKKINLFKIRRTKGWWPFKALDKDTKEELIGGKLEAELEIVTKDEAEKTPVGLGRQGPQALPPPNFRDKTTFDEEIPSYFSSRNPFKNSKCIFCGSQKCKIILALIILLIFILVIMLGLYFGGYLESHSINYYKEKPCKNKRYVEEQII